MKVNQRFIVGVIAMNAAQSAFDLGGSINEHMQSAYDMWRSEFIRTGIDSMEKDEIAYSVLEKINQLLGN